METEDSQQPRVPNTRLARLHMLSFRTSWAVSIRGRQSARLGQKHHQGSEASTCASTLIRVSTIRSTMIERMSRQQGIRNTIMFPCVRKTQGGFTSWDGSRLCDNVLRVQRFQTRGTKRTTPFPGPGHVSQVPPGDRLSTARHDHCVSRDKQGMQQTRMCDGPGTGSRGCRQGRILVPRRTRTPIIQHCSVTRPDSRQCPPKAQIRC